MSEISNLSPEDERLFTIFGRGSHSEIPFRTVHAAFLHHAEQTPQALAVYDLASSPTREVTYADLRQYAKFIAVRLQKHGVHRDSRVTLVAKRGMALVAGILGVLMCGAQYVPLDGSVAPNQTLQRVINQSDRNIVLCLRAFKQRIEELRAAPVVLEDLLQEAESQWSEIDLMENLCEGDENSGCYVLYTSGTTGTPKGVDVTHRNVTNFICVAPGNLGMGPDSRVGSVLAISFDLGAWEILGSLCNGATLVLRGSNWNAAMREIDTLICTPSILGKYDPIQFPNIKCIATCGEPCPQDVADKWATAARFYNCCGPTEVTIANTMIAHTPGHTLSIGRPTPNNNVYILDDDEKPVPIGRPGVMWGGGAGIAKGYVDLPDKTAEKFRYDKFANDGSMMYNTGDLGRWLPDGNLEILGRRDEQVKIKGFRVELDGVSASLRACPGVKEAIAVMVDNELTGFVAPFSCNTNMVAEHMKPLLPYYAIPTRWRTVESLPLTSHGKVDKRALAGLITLDTTSIEIGKGACKINESASVTLPTTSSEASFSNIRPQPVALPEKNLPKPLRGLRFLVFIVYRRLFSIVWLANTVALICILAIPSIGRQWLSIMSFINLTVAILVRQDFVINALWEICCSIPKSWPLAIRRRCAKIIHFGGIHSGAATAGVGWYIGNLCYNVKCSVDGCSLPEKPSTASLVLSFIVSALLLCIVALAWPTFRKKHHNTFECVHRFCGWTAVTLIWAQTILSTRDQRNPNQSLGNAVVRSSNFWMLVTITLSIATSWLFLSRVRVDAEVLSNHAVRLHFKYSTMPVHGSTMRISKRPLVEWHSFATIAAPVARNGRMKGYSLVISRAGDWTGSLISNPPTHIWTRGIPTCGVMRIATLFNSVVLVGTGSGIGPLFGHIQSPACRFRLVWSTPSPATTFGQEIVDAVYRADEGAIIHDTRVLGRPDMVQLTWSAVREFGAEAVIVIANEKVTKKIVYSMETRGIPAYGAIWDS